LEKAVAAGVNRPRPYVELARLRLTGLTRGQTTGRLFSTAEIAPVVEPLRRALRLPPELPEAYGMLADVWVRSHENAPPEDVEALARGARLFALNPAVSYRLALALARCGRRTEAGELLTTGIDYVPDDAARARYQQLLTALTRPAATTK
jgi:cytochrome c-type biogenesis protein CcmH/NrfG